MITSSNSSVKRSGVATQYLGVLLHTMAISGLPHVRTELGPLLVIPSLAHHPVQTNSQSACHRDFGDLPAPPHHQVKVSAAPFWKTAHRNLRCLHQQEAQHRTSLLGDVTQPPTVTAGVLQWNQTEIAGQLLATLKAFRLPDDQHKRQCGERTDSGMGRQSLRLGAPLHFLPGAPSLSAGFADRVGINLAGLCRRLKPTRNLNRSSHPGLPPWANYSSALRALMNRSL